MANGSIEGHGGPASGTAQGPTRKLGVNEYWDGERIRRNPRRTADPGRQGQAGSGNPAPAEPTFHDPGPEPSAAEARIPAASRVEAKRFKLTEKASRSFVQHAFRIISFFGGAHWVLQPKEVNDLGDAIVETQEVFPAPLLEVATRASAPARLFLGLLEVVAPRLAVTATLRMQTVAARQAQAQAQANDAKMRAAGFGGIRYDQAQQPPPQPPPPPPPYTRGFTMPDQPPPPPSQRETGLQTDNTGRVVWRDANG